MAVLAISLAGAGLGSALGVGASVGWLVGSVIGNMLFGPKPPSTVVEGPRLGDLTVTSSAYGAPIPYGYGTVRIAGNIIWSSGIEEVTNVQSQKVGGGKGGGKKATQTQITYSYFSSFAIAFGEGPADGVIRIWADSKLLYDIGSGTEDPTKLEGLTFRFYHGDETQVPDGLIETDVGDGMAPAHRGMVYIVFDRLPLANFGNRIPNISAEIAFKQATVVQPVLVWTPIDHPQAGHVTDGNVLAVDFSRKLWYAAKFIGAQGTRALRRIQYSSMVEDRVVLDNDVFTISDPADFSALDNLFVGRDGYLYGNGSGGNSKPIMRIDPNSMKQIDEWGTTSVSTSNGVTSFAAIDYFGMASCYGPAGQINFLICGGFFNQIGVLLSDPLTYVWGAGMTLDESRNIGIASGEIFDEIGTAYVVGGGTTGGPGNSATLGIYKITVNFAAAYSPVTLGTTGVDFDKLVEFDPTDLLDASLSPTAFAGCKLIGLDPTDLGLVIGINNESGSDARIFKWTEEDGVVWNTSVPDFYNASTSAVASNNKLTGVTYSWIGGGSGNTPRTIDLRTGELEIGDVISGLSAGYPQMYDGLANSVLFRNGSDGGGTGSVYWKRVFLGRAEAAAEELSVIVADLCERSGLGLGDIEVSQLTDDVPGFIVGRPGTAKDALTPLTQAYFFDGVESDYLMKFIKRGQASMITIPERDLASIDDNTNEVWKESRTQEVELPERMNVLFMLQENDYQQGTQSAKRVSLPNPAMSSKTQVNLELPIVLSADTAKQIAEKWLFTSWLERVTYEAILSWQYMALDPTDVVTVQLDSGATFVSRLIKSEVGVNLAIGTNFIAQDAASYDSTATGSAGLGLPQQVIPGTAFTKLFLLDVPLLRDVDDTNGIASRTYYMMGGYGSDGWPGALLYKSQDNVSFAEAGQNNVEVAWGVLVNTLGSPVTPFATDIENTITVFMNTGKDRLESVTELEMLNGANGAVILNSDGTPEIIQFQDVVENDDGSFTLSNLLRGRRGTDVYCDGHTSGEFFILLETQTTQAILLGLNELNLIRYYKGVGFGTLFEDADLESRSNTGRDLKPYAPVNFTADESGGDITLGWDRRTRINGQLLDSVGDVPLNEETEEYEIDIYDGPDVIRTLVATSESVVYDSADITTDFGSPPATLKFAVYQISAAVGRGFGYIKTIEVT